ncbi:hypothetical protein [Rhodoblastus sp.]
MIGAIRFIVAYGAGIDPKRRCGSLTMVKEFGDTQRNKNSFDKNQSAN